MNDCFYKCDALLSHPGVSPGAKDFITSVRDMCAIYPEWYPTGKQRAWVDHYYKKLFGSTCLLDQHRHEPRAALDDVIFMRPRKKWVPQEA